MTRKITIQDLRNFRDSHKWRPMQHQQEIIEFINVALSNLPQSNNIVFLEIGVLKGGNFVFIGDMLKRFYANVYGIGIDLPGIIKYAGNDVNPEEEVLALHPTFKYNIIIGNSQHQHVIKKTKHLLCGKNIDILFIDGDHSYNGCMSDFNNYSPMVRKNGIIGFHDIGEQRFDVRTKVWPKIQSQYKKTWEFVFKPGHFGIGVIVKDKK